MTTIVTLGIDLAKNLFQLHGEDAAGNRVLKKQMTRKKLSAFMSALPPCLVGLEACGGSHYWTKLFQSYGHDVRMMAPYFVAAYVKSNKNDVNDAAAICEAVTRPSMRFVAHKSDEQLSMQMLHRVRQQAVKQRTAIVNQIRGYLLEYGLTIPQGISHIRSHVPAIIESGDNDLSMIVRALFQDLYDELNHLDERVKHYDAQIKEKADTISACKHLMGVEGVGPLTATAFWASIGDPTVFKNGRECSAFLGLVPRQHSSGGKTVLKSISKRGDRYLRTLLIHGGRTLVKASEKGKRSRHQRIRELKERRGFNRTAVAMANKNARIMWALMRYGTEYEPEKALGAIAA